MANTPYIDGLTNTGIELLAKSGFTEIFETARHDLAGKLSAYKPGSRSYTMLAARELMGTLADYPAFAPIKEYANKTGEDYASILQAGAITLTEYYLSLYPELK